MLSREYIQKSPRAVFVRYSIHSADRDVAAMAGSIEMEVRKLVIE